MGSEGMEVRELNKKGGKNEKKKKKKLSKMREHTIIPRFRGVVRSWILVEALGMSHSLPIYGDNKNRTAKL